MIEARFGNQIEVGCKNSRRSASLHYFWKLVPRCSKSAQHRLRVQFSSPPSDRSTGACHSKFAMGVLEISFIEPAKCMALEEMSSHARFQMSDFRGSSPWLAAYPNVLCDIRIFWKSHHISPWLIANPQLPSSASWQGFSLRLIIDTLPKKLGWVWFMIFLHLFAKFTSQFAQFPQLPTLGSSAPTAGSCTLANWANAPRTSKQLFGMASFHEHHLWDESMRKLGGSPQKKDGSTVQRTQIRDKSSEMHYATHKNTKCSPSVSWNSGLECFDWTKLASCAMAVASWTRASAGTQLQAISVNSPAMPRTTRRRIANQPLVYIHPILKTLCVMCSFWETDGGES